MTAADGPLEASAANEESRVAWEANAAYWDEHMGEGNAWVEQLCWPALEGLLDLEAGERVLDVACGNGLIARRVAALGASVVAFDFSAALIERARARTQGGSRIEYHVLDATDEAALLDVLDGPFDGAVSNMALMDMPLVAPLFRALARLLRPGGRFVFSLSHPAFNGGRFTLFAESRETGTGFVTEYGVRRVDYLDASPTRGEAIRGQPVSQPYFDRPISELLRPAFDAGFVLDAFEERAFGPDAADESRGPHWRNMQGIPPVLVVRLRRPAA